MEVVLRNVPQYVSDDQLKRELKPFMNALGVVNFHVEKPRKKPQAWILFLTPADGAKFLKKHGKVNPVTLSQDNDQQTDGSLNHRNRPRAIAKLHILKTAVFAEKSLRPLDRLLLSSLVYEKEHQAAAPDRNPRLPAVRARVSYIACGKNMFMQPSNTLTFIQQTIFRGRPDNAALFGGRSFKLTMGDWRMDIPYNLIQDLIADSEKSCLTFVLSEPPRFYQSSVPGDEVTYGNAQWKRKTSIEMWPDHFRYVACCLVYQICLYQSHFYDTIKALRSRDLLSVTRQSLPVNATPRPREEDYSTSMATFLGKIGKFGVPGRGNVLPFVILFQVQLLVCNNYLHPAKGSDMLDAMERIALDCRRSGKPLPFTTDAMKNLYTKIPYPCSGTVPQDLEVEVLLEHVIRLESSLRLEDPERTRDYGGKIPERQAWVLKLIVTPTRILLAGPDAESKNRVLRMFSDRTDYFVRVTFCDEDGQDLPYNPRISNNDVFDRYRAVLREGVQIAGRRFSFLGFSHSSLRSHSAWFSAPFIDNRMKRQTYDTIIKALGDFRGIRIPAKCAARIGQAFSETPFAVPIFERRIDIQYITDVKTADGSRVFSDGVGTISRLAMEEVWDHIPRKSQTPTCFQVRIAGVKGMLSLDSRLKGRIICIRKESMMKFESNDFVSLGICDTASQPLKLVLNRQIIKILEDMGTKDQWFMDQQNKALTTLRAVTSSASNTGTFLEYQDIGSVAGLPRLIKLLDKMNIDYRRDRFMKSLVEHVVLRELRMLKHKARIPVDQGVTLFGVMDETAFLKEGEIYVTYDRKYDKIQGRVKGSLKDGYVIVTRSPALHPGDVQYVKMVTPPDGHPLRHLENCIVFSQRGKRDLPSQLSGGDLDGDLYSVIWDPEACPQRQFSPADYPRVMPEPLSREVTRDDIADFFINFMATDVLGLIAIRHQILADINEEGTLDPQCTELAELHSTAVDYSKTGIPVDVQDIPRRTRTRPDFLAPAPPLKLFDLGQIDYILDREDDEDEEDGMGTVKHRFHKSEKILGRLYRGVDERKIWNEEIHRPVNMDGPTVWEQLIGRVMTALDDHGYGPDDIIYQRRIEDAWKIRLLYENAMSDNMWHFAENPRTPITEVEAFCGSLLKKVGRQTQRERDSSMKLKEQMEGVMTWIVKLIRDRTTSGENAPPTFDGGERERMNAVELCWACVMVGCSKKPDDPKTPYYGTGDMESFRVLAACCLAKELSDLLNHSNRADTGGGYLGVHESQQQHMVLPMR
ncbi:putative RNA-dependent RNA polymerase 1-like protein [Cladobotryum mycophilum]|uniref:RNA-dependent RNA polymerase n=1 Tax=Cladobotryum mycophilum TaxID=491253 RepID=A0ABR0T191_9HYPO